ncbi:MAG TPA: histidine phosphatase family protein [Xanthobacteraceae bacterium]|jgi:probable phosphoglycerate mutase|nr:histidine phosphatase family protein [Xanthobacteraceae bacterium]
MSRIILVRHGHVEGIDPPRFRGRTELALTDRGRRQARETAKRIQASWNPVGVYSSPLGRCVATATAIAAAVRTSPPEILESLNDLDYGAWQSRTYEEVKADAPELFELWLKAPHLVRFPAGESLQDLAARVADALRLVLERHPHDAVVMVGHDSVNRALLLQVLDQPLSAYWRLSQDPCGISEIQIANGESRVHRVNETYHLRQDS